MNQMNQVSPINKTHQVNQMNKTGCLMSSCTETVEVRHPRCDEDGFLFDEDLFKDTLTRERRRTERSGLAMVMLLVGVHDGRRENTSAVFEKVVKVLSAIKSDIDIAGWFQRESIMGLIVPEIDTANVASTYERLQSEYRKEITNRFEEHLAERVSITLRVFPEPQGLGDEECLAVDPFLYPELQSRQARMVTFQVVKRGMDILVSFLLLIILSPLLLAIAGLVKWSSRGPVLFRQERIGQMLKPFMFFKFRTMYVGSGHAVHHEYVSWFIRSSGTAQEKGKHTVFKMTNDPRITTIGHLLRKTSLDELPQLWNVLLGDMSLVGPRPSLRYEVQHYKQWHRHRVLGAKPGITGLWQVTGRSRTTFDEMVRLDIRYAREQSLWADAKILLATPAAVINGSGAC